MKAYKKAARKVELRADEMRWAVAEYIRQAGAPLELREIVNFFSRVSEARNVRALGIRFTVRPEFLVSSIERSGSGLMTQFDGQTKLVTTVKIGWGRKPILAKDIAKVASNVLPYRKKVG